MSGGNGMSLREKRLNSLANGSNEGCTGLLLVADRTKPSAENYQRQLARLQHSLASPSSLNRISGTPVSLRGRPVIQMYMSMLHIEIQTKASIFNLQRVTLKFGD